MQRNRRLRLEELNLKKRREISQVPHQVAVELRHQAQIATEVHLVHQARAQVVKRKEDS